MPPQSYSYSDPYTESTIGERRAGDEKQMSFREPLQPRVEISESRLSSSDSLSIQSSGVPALGRRTQANKVPPQVEAWKEFRRICDALVGELRRVDDHLDGEVVAETGSGAVLEVECLLEKLYACPWGNEECLKRTVVAIQTQINNAQWTRQHVNFLKEVVRWLRVRYIIDEDVVSEVKEAIKRHGLKIFRGTVSEPTDAVKKYRIVEITDE